MVAVPNHDLYLPFVLVSKSDMITEIIGAIPQMKLSIGGRPVTLIDFTLNELGQGFYWVVIPGKYIGGENPIIFIAESNGSATWRDIIPMEYFPTEGGDLFEPELLPSESPIDPPIEPPTTDPELGDDLLITSQWTFHDAQAGGSLSQVNQELIVVLGPSNGRTRQLFTNLPLEDGNYQLEVTGSSNLNSEILPDIIMHGAPYHRLTDPTDIGSILLSQAESLTNKDFRLDGYNNARVRIIFPNSIPSGSKFIFSSIFYAFV